MHKIMKEVKKHIQNKYIRNAFILQNWRDIHIADIPTLAEIRGKEVGFKMDVETGIKKVKIAECIPNERGKKP